MPFLAKNNQEGYTDTPQSKESIFEKSTRGISENGGFMKTTQDRLLKYQVIFKLFPSARYVDHTSYPDQSLLKPWYQLTVSPIYRRRLISDNLRETIIDIDAHGIRDDKRVLKCARKVLRNAREILGITYDHWWIGMSGNWGLHMHLFTDWMSYDLEDYLVLGVPKLSKGSVGYDTRILKRQKTLIRPFGSFNRKANHYKSLIKAKEIFKMNILKNVNEEDVLYPAEIKPAVFQNGLKHITEVLNESDPCSDIRGAFVIYAKIMGKKTESEIIDIIMERAIWTNKNRQVIQKKVHDYFGYIRLFSESKLNILKFTYKGKSHTEFFNNGINNILINNTSINNKSTVPVAGLKKTTMFCAKPSCFEGNEFGITIFRVDHKLPEEERGAWKVHKYIGHMYRGNSKNKRGNETDAVLELTVAQNYAMMKAVDEAYESGAIKARIPIDVVILVKPQGEGKCRPEVKVISPQKAQEIKNLSDTEIKNSVF